MLKAKTHIQRVFLNKEIGNSAGITEHSLIDKIQTKLNAETAMGCDLRYPQLPTRKAEEISRGEVCALIRAKLRHLQDLKCQV
jgi:hypothetical protein